MRARLQKFLPIVLIALAMQVLAPIAACWAAGLAVADPLQNTVICHTGDAAGGGLDDPSGAPGAHAGSCSICCLAQANATIEAAQASLLVPFRLAEGVIWHVQVAVVAATDGRSNARARAPPELA